MLSDNLEPDCLLRIRLYWLDDHRKIEVNISDTNLDRRIVIGSFIIALPQ